MLEIVDKIPVILNALPYILQGSVVIPHHRHRISGARVLHRPSPRRAAGVRPFVHPPPHRRLCVVFPGNAHPAPAVPLLFRAVRGHRPEPVHHHGVLPRPRHGERGLPVPDFPRLHRDAPRWASSARPRPRHERRAGPSGISSFRRPCACPIPGWSNEFSILLQGLGPVLRPRDPGNHGPHPLQWPRGPTSICRSTSRQACCTSASPLWACTSSACWNARSIFPVTPSAAPW